MSPGEMVVRGSVWVALLCYPAGPLGPALAGDRARQVAGFIWSAGCAAFLVHVVSAFAVAYDWSHAVALAETARQTAEVTGTRTGAGLYLNYLFTLVWLTDVIRWWLRPERTSQRRWAGFLLMHLFFLFMIFNGTVVFEDGATRVMGLLVTLAGSASLALALRRRVEQGRANQA